MGKYKDITEKQASKDVMGSSGFPKEFLEEFEIGEKTFASWNVENPEEEARRFKKEMKEKGFTTTSQKNDFTDLARGYAISVGFAKRKLGKVV